LDVFPGSSKFFKFFVNCSFCLNFKHPAFTIGFFQYKREVFF
jgi:hypothetical protein